MCGGLSPVSQILARLWLCHKALVACATTPEVLSGKENPTGFPKEDIETDPELTGSPQNQIIHLRAPCEHFFDTDRLGAVAASLGNLVVKNTSPASNLTLHGCSLEPHAPSPLTTHTLTERLGWKPPQSPSSSNLADPPAQAARRPSIALGTPRDGHL